MKTLVSKIGRVVIPMVTPFRESGEIDYRKAQELALLLIERKYCDALAITGTNGEFYNLNLEERMILFEKIKETIGSKAPLIAGTGANTTKDTIALTKRAEELGYTAALILPPYYGRPTQGELLVHFEKIAASCQIPIILYNIPIFAGVNIEPSTSVRLSKIDNIIGVKEEAGLLPLQTSEILNSIDVPDDFAVYCGDDTMVLSTIVQGASGCVSGTSHIVGDYMKAQVAALLNGQVDKAIEFHKKIYAFTRAITPNGRTNPVSLLKVSLAVTGFNVGHPRQPYVEPSTEEIENLKAVLKSIGKM